jgi:hypothetical protein
MTKRIYVAGAYSADNVIDVLQNIGRGEHYAAKLILEGFAPHFPWHDKDYCIRMWREKFTVEQFREYSVAWLRVSDAMFLVPGWEGSQGTRAEIRVAREMDIPIFKRLQNIRAWRDDRGE